MIAEAGAIDGPCETALLLASRALEGDLTVSEQTLLATHLAGCANCRLITNGLGVVNRLIKKPENKSTALSESHDKFTQLVMQRIRLEASQTKGIVEFTQLLAQQPDLQSQFKPAASLKSFVELFVRVGWQRGFRFTPGEVVSLLNARSVANDELSDEQLSAAVGGVGSIGDAYSAASDLNTFFKNAIGDIGKS